MADRNTTSDLNNIHSSLESQSSSVSMQRQSVYPANNWTNFHFSTVLRNLNSFNNNTDYFKRKRREYISMVEAQHTQQYSQFLQSHRLWEELAKMDMEVKQRKNELDNLTKIIAALDRECAVRQRHYDDLIKRVSTQIDTIMTSTRAQADGGLLAFARSARKCAVCCETKREVAFVWNVVCSHSICFACLKKSRDFGIETCVICHAKQPSSSFLMLYESPPHCRFVAIPM